jgi:hypothetical protein
VIIGNGIRTPVEISGFCFIEDDLLNFDESPVASGNLAYSLLDSSCISILSLSLTLLH